MAASSKPRKMDHTSPQTDSMMVLEMNRRAQMTQAELDAEWEAAQAKAAARREAALAEVGDDDSFDREIELPGAIAADAEDAVFVPPSGKGGDFNGANQYGAYNNSPTEKQVGFLTSLLRDRLDKTGLSVESTIEAMQANGQWTKRGVSAAIDNLKKSGATPAAKADAPAASVRANKFGGKCVTCGGWVDEGAGRIEKRNDKWAVLHLDGECVEAKPADEPVALEGMHRTADGEIYKVQVAVHGSGREYAKHLVQQSDGGWKFEYEQGAVRKLSPATLMTLEEAKEFGHLYGVCCVCAAVLTDERSIEAGIGPVCAGRL